MPDNKTAHTPGPWTNQNGNISGQWETGKKVGIALVGITHFCGEEYGGPRDRRMAAEDKANARLIAAAPDLLRVLKHGVDSLDFGGKPTTALGHAIREWQAQARAAIAAAEGKE